MLAQVHLHFGPAATTEIKIAVLEPVAGFWSPSDEVYRGSSNNQAENWCRHLFSASTLTYYTTRRPSALKATEKKRNIINEKCHTYVSFIHQWLYSPLLGPGLLFSFVIFFTQTIRLLGWVISLSQGCYLHTGHHKHRINAGRHPCLEWDSNPRSQCLS
jgi:hypothetical protein